MIKSYKIVVLNKNNELIEKVWYHNFTNKTKNVFGRSLKLLALIVNDSNK